MIYTYDVTIKRMSEPVPTHALFRCENVETAIKQAREQFPGALVINVQVIPDL